MVHWLCRTDYTRMSIGGSMKSDNNSEDEHNLWREYILSYTLLWRSIIGIYFKRNTTNVK